MYVGSQANWTTIRSVVHSLVHRYHDQIDTVLVAPPEIRVDPGPRVDPLESASPQLQGHRRVEDGQRGSARAVLVVGDRWDVACYALGAHLRGARIAHVMGGERSGSQDDAYRGVVSALAGLHLTASDDASARLRLFGYGRIVQTGCPRLDALEPLVRDPVRGRVVLCLHPDTTSPLGDLAIRSVIESALVRSSELHVVTPSNEPGRDEIVRAYEWYRIEHRRYDPDEFGRLLATADYAIGNSSSLVRDCGFLGTGAVLIGSRQSGRDHGEHAVNVTPGQSIGVAIEGVRGKRYPRDTRYGSGAAGPVAAAAIVAWIGEVCK